MPQSPPALVTPSALRWARESIGYELEEAAERIGVSAEKLAAAERGDAYLTLRQAEKIFQNCSKSPIFAVARTIVSSSDGPDDVLRFWCPGSWEREFEAYS